MQGDELVKVVRSSVILSQKNIQFSQITLEHKMYVGNRINPGIKERKYEMSP